MNCPLRLFLLPTLAFLWMVSGTSCSSSNDYYYGGLAAGGGYYVSQFGPAMQRTAQDIRRFGSSMVARVAGPRDDSFWNGDDVPGKPRLRISLSEQRVFFYKGGHLVGMSPISSGREGYGTKPGRYSIIEKDIDHKSSWYGDYVSPHGEVIRREIDVRKDPKPRGAIFDAANMRYFMRIYGATGMHEGYLPGYAASHGCIRLPGHMAAAFYHATPLGTPVEIVR